MRLGNATILLGCLLAALILMPQSLHPARLADVMETAIKADRLPSLATSVIAAAPCTNETWPDISPGCLRTATPDQTVAKARVVVAR